MNQPVASLPDSLAAWLAYIERQHAKPIELGLERMREVAQRMRLKRPAKKVITVGGTNGKGSTVAFIEAIARAAGWKVGAYTSPHLLAYNERVRIDGNDADDAALVAGFAAVEAARLAPNGTHTPLTYFEYGTLAALWLFERCQLDLAVLEVGLGGRLDSVNLVDADVAVITTVDLDHQDYLGHDREAIGREKAGIARAWKPLVLGDDDPPSSVLGHAYAIGASAIRANCDFFFEPVDPGHWRWREVGYAVELPRPRLAAPAQVRNAATAIAALRALGASIPQASIPQAAISAGVANAHARGRLQRYQRAGVEIAVDVGHNPQAARMLATWLQQAPVTGRTWAVFAALGNKDAAGVVAALAGGIDGWFLAGLEAAGPRGEGVGALVRRLYGTAAADGARHDTVAEALAGAQAAASPGDRILVFGSFHTVAAALQVLDADTLPEAGVWSRAV
jgi:dihydrofolate synthase/folylpolyglutamate synthase